MGKVYLLILTTIFTGIVSSGDLRLTMYPKVARDGENVTLSCARSSDILSVSWIINADKIFTTKSGIDRNRTTVAGISVSSMELYSDLNQRMTVNISTNSHNVSLRINSSVDNGKVWECHIGGTLSNPITVNVTEDRTAAEETPATSSTSTVKSSALVTHQNTSTQTSGLETDSSSSKPTSPITTEQSQGGRMKSGDNTIYIIAGAVAGAVVVVVAIVVAAVICIRRKKSRREDNMNGIDNHWIDNDNNHKAAKNSPHHGYMDIDPYSCTTTAGRATMTYSEEKEIVDNDLYVGYSESGGKVDQRKGKEKPEIFENDLYEGFSDLSDNVDLQVVEGNVADLYTQVQKKKKPETRGTEDLDQLYAKPVKKKDRGQANVTVNVTVNMNVDNTVC